MKRDTKHKRRKPLGWRLEKWHRRMKHGRKCKKTDTRMKVKRRTHNDEKGH